MTLRATQGALRRSPRARSRSWPQALCPPSPPGEGSLVPDSRIPEGQVHATDTAE